jgi:hypothetical protein
MLPLRACEYPTYLYPSVVLTKGIAILDTFIGLNAIRVLSIISLLLVFASSIVIMVHDIQAVNRFVQAGSSSSDSSEMDYNYIECVATIPFVVQHADT